MCGGCRPDIGSFPAPRTAIIRVSTSRSRGACAPEFCQSQGHEKPFARKGTRVPSGAPGGAGVVGHATRTDVATRPRFGRGARHRTIRLREPPASGALRLPALHHHRGSLPRLSTAAARAPLPPRRRPASSTGALTASGKIRLLTRKIGPLSSINSYGAEAPTCLNLSPRRLSDQ
jgi:hypothetical protein